MFRLRRFEFETYDLMSCMIVPKEWFETWRQPREFFRAADDCMGKFETDEILGMSGVQHLFDAYVTGLFARIWNDHNPCSVRLVIDRFPDAQLCDATDTLDLEVTMADQKDRKMAEEHRLLRQKRECGEPSVLPIERARDREYALEAVPRVCREKVKRYLGAERSAGQVSVSLLVYVNFSTLAGPVLSDDEMEDLTRPWRDNFRAIWLLCGARIFRPWPSRIIMTALSDPLS